jgi:hypothetical protein
MEVNRMKSFLETVAGLGVTAVVLIGGSIVFGLANGDTGEEVAPFFGWGLAILAVSLIVYWISKSFTPPEKSADIGRSIGEDVEAKENNRKVAIELADSGGMLGIQARQWLNAHEVDSSVPIYGVRPYWTPTGPGGTPQLFSVIGLRGLDSRLAYVRKATAGDPLLAIMANDPNPLVRDAARSRLR